MLSTISFKKSFFPALTSFPRQLLSSQFQFFSWLRGLFTKYLCTKMPFSQTPFIIFLFSSPEAGFEPENLSLWVEFSTTVLLGMSHLAMYLLMRENQLQVSAARCPHGSQICFATLFSKKSQNCCSVKKARVFARITISAKPSLFGWKIKKLSYIGPPLGATLG